MVVVGKPPSADGSEEPESSGSKASLRVLIVSQYFFPETFRINDVAEALARLGCDVTVLTGHPNYPSGTIFPGYTPQRPHWDDRSNEYRVARVPLIPRGPKGALGLALNYISFVVSGIVFGTWLLRRRRFDVTLVFAPSPILQALPAIWLKWMKRFPIVLWVQDLWPQSLEVTGFVKNRAILGAVGAVTYWIYARCDLLLGQSRAFVTDLEAVSGRTPVEYHPTPGDLPGPPAEASEVPVLPSAFNVVFTGNLGVAQSLETIVGAATALRHRQDICFVVVGDGSRRIWLADEVDRLGLTNFMLVGRVRTEVIPAILDQASALLVTLGKSDAMAKTIPAKISTYLSAGKPIVASMDGEAAQVVEEAGAGIACPAEDALALAGAIERLASEEPSHLAQMGRNGRVYYDANFEPNMLTRRLLGYLKAVIARDDLKSVSRTGEAT